MPVEEPAAEPVADPVDDPAEVPETDPAEVPETDSEEPEAPVTEEPSEPADEEPVEPADEQEKTDQSLESNEEPSVEPSVEPSEEPAEEPAEEPSEEPAPAMPERSVKIVVMDSEDGSVYAGDRIGLCADLKGYENVSYTLQWQRWDADEEAWKDLPGQTNHILWLDVTEGMDGSQWQVVVTVAD